MLHREKQLAEVEGLHIDAVLLQGDLIKTSGFEGGGPGSDAAEVKALHTVDHPQMAAKSPQILLKFGTEGMDHMGLQYRERYPILGEYIGDRELAAEGVAPVSKVHLADLIGIGLHENGTPAS